MSDQLMDECGYPIWINPYTKKKYRYPIGCQNPPDDECITITDTQLTEMSEAEKDRIGICGAGLVFFHNHKDDIKNNPKAYMHQDYRTQTIIPWLEKYYRTNPQYQRLKYAYLGVCEQSILNYLQLLN